MRHFANKALESHPTNVQFPMIRAHERVVADWGNLQKIPIHSRPVYPIEREGILAAVSGRLEQFRNYSTNEIDWMRHQYSCHSLTALYHRNGYGAELNEYGKAQLNVDHTPKSLEFGSNCISLGIPGKSTTNKLITAHHCIAEFIDDYGYTVDKNNQIIGTTQMSRGEPVYELKMCVLDQEIGGKDSVNLIGCDPALDIACIESQNEYSCFMEIDYEILENPLLLNDVNQLIMMGIRTYSSSGTVDYDGRQISTEELNSIFGVEGKMNMMGLAVPIDKYAESIVPSQELAEFDKGKCIEFLDANNQTFKHWLNSLPGDSGRGLSRTPNKIFAVHHAADNREDTVIGGTLVISKCKFNYGSLINECITRHLKQ